MDRSSQNTDHHRIRNAMAAERFMAAARRLRRALKYNPYWYLQPRVPAGDPEGGQWVLGTGSSMGPVLQRLVPAAAAKLREIAQLVRPYLLRSPRRWLSDDKFPEVSQFDKQTERIGPPSWQRFGHPNIRFRSERELREYLGPAGPGREWHHIVEKRLAENGRFPAEVIHSTDNIINLPVAVHRRINAIMSAKDEETGGVVRRRWMERFSYGEQYNMGLDLIKKASKELGYDLPRY